MRREVVLTQDAEHDLGEICAYIAKFDSVASADHVLKRILDVADKLTIDPERGSQPPELRAIGMRDFRQVFCKPYRVIYRIHEARVVIYLIADDRRDLQSVLAQRLLRG
jgi:toxin ParE1/3/4